MSKLATYEGVVERGHVTLPPEADIPEKTRVLVVVPAAQAKRTAGKTPEDSSAEDINDITRTQIFEAWSRGNHPKEIAAATNLSVSTVYRYLASIQQHLARMQQRNPYIASPRLAHPEQAKDFVKEIIEETPDASV
jgi:DNA-binding NarL/FixJ family response regulator